jgi:hypothetical protein
MASQPIDPVKLAQAKLAARVAANRATAAASFDVDEHTAELLAQLQPTFGVQSNAAVIRKALALASIAREHADDDGTITISGGASPPVKVSLAG